MHLTDVFHVELWKRIQDEWMCSLGENWTARELRKKFHKHLHQVFGAGGEKLLRAVLVTGRTAEHIQSELERQHDPAQSRVQTVRDPFPSERKVAKRARADVRYASNLAAAQWRKRGVCERCGYPAPAIVGKCEESSFVRCLSCHRDCCMRCVAKGSTTCYHCAGGNWYHSGTQRPAYSNPCSSNADIDEFCSGRLQTRASELTAALMPLPKRN